MIIRNYRCYNCTSTERPGMQGKDFTMHHDESETLVTLPNPEDPGKPVKGFQACCPDCGTKNTDPDGGNVVPILVIHYEGRKNVKNPNGRGTGHIACDHTKKTATSDTLRYTGEPSVVNCPACKATKEFREQSTGKLDESYEIQG